MTPLLMRRHFLAGTSGCASQVQLGIREAHVLLHAPSHKCVWMESISSHFARYCLAFLGSGIWSRLPERTLLHMSDPEKEDMKI